MSQLSQISNSHCLISVKIKDCNETEQIQLAHEAIACGQRQVIFDVFLHTFDNLDAEQTLLKNARKIFCGNDEISKEIVKSGFNPTTLWCPSLIAPDSSVPNSSLNLFSFGMAHKIQQSNYFRLHETLERLETSFNLRVSTAFHEKANFGDFDSVSTELQFVFGNKLSFLGFLSDASVNFFLETSDLFVAFFEKGVRANNTSIYAAMAKQCPVLTNLDQWSPNWLEHGQNVLDISRLSESDLTRANLKRIGKTGQHDCGRHSSWEALTKEIITLSE